MAHVRRVHAGAHLLAERERLPGVGLPDQHPRLEDLGAQRLDVAGAAGPRHALPGQGGGADELAVEQGAERLTGHGVAEEPLIADADGDVDLPRRSPASAASHSPIHSRYELTRWMTKATS